MVINMNKKEATTDKTCSPTTRVTERIEAYRLELGVSENQLSKDSCIPLTTLKRRLKHDDRLTLPELHALSDALGTTTEFWNQAAPVTAAA